MARSGGHKMGHEKEPPQFHKGERGRAPLVHSHSKRIKRSLKTGVKRG
jgi:hypothetical protein